MTDPTLPPQVSAKLGDYAAFRAEMLALIPRVVVDAGGTLTRPLARLDLGVPTDPTVAMVDAFAAVADVISFYQDRVLNEGYLATAVDYSSLALMARSLGGSPGAYISATAEVALFAQPGAPVTVAQGTVLQASPPKPAGGASGPNAAAAPASAAAAPIFETAADVVADSALNRLTPLQTKPVHLDPAARSLLVQGTGLGLVVGDFMLLVRRGKPTQWMRLTVFSVRENSTLKTTSFGIGSSLQSQWTASGCTEPLPRNAADKLELYALDLTCRLFGYNAPSWSSQSAAVKRASTPTGVPPAEFSEWPGFGIALDDLDLQAVYPKVLPGSQFLLETPEENTLGVIAAVSRQNIAEFGLTGQVTQVALAPAPAVLPTGVALIPSRTGVTASLLSDGRVLLAGGVGEAGALDSVEVYDPATGLLSQAATLPAGRGLHTATTIDGVVYLVGGVTQGVAGDWRFATDVLQLDPTTLSFSPIPDVAPATTRIGHAATALPDGTLMVSGGLTGDPSFGHASLEALLTASAATLSVTVFAPLQKAWTWNVDMGRARAGHSATLCPVVKTAADGGSASAPPVGQVVVFLGGHEGNAMTTGMADSEAAGAIWDDAEVTDPIAWKPVPGLYPIESAGGGKTGSARYDHVATVLPGADGFLVTGGQSPAGPVGDDWLVGAFASYPSGGSPGFTAVPTFVPAPPLLSPRSNHAAAVLQEGEVVVAGGVAGSQVLASVELFKVSAGTSIPFHGDQVLAASVAGAPLPQAQTDAAFLALSGDTLLLAGGLGALPADYLNAVVAYDADVGTFAAFPGPILTTPYTLAPTGSVGLADGTILILGATSPAPFPDPTAKLTGFAWTFDPTSNLSTMTGAPATARVGATLSLLSNGTVLVAGGMGMTDEGYAVLDTAEIYDPRTRSFRKVYHKMTEARCGHTATVLVDGSVLLAGGYAYPPLTYDPPGVLATWIPALDSAEVFDIAQQAFTPATTSLPQGFALHSATLLATGDVLIAGGVTDFYTERAFASIEAFPSTQAAIFNVSARAFALIAPLGTPRALHSATLLTSGKVLVAGGVVRPDMKATATTELFDPDNSTFGPSATLAALRRSQGAILVPAGLLLIGGADTPSYEIIGEGEGGQTAYPLPFPLPSPDYPVFASLSEAVTPIAVAGRGVYAFGGQVASGGESTCEGILYIAAPPAPGSDTRRQALVYTQSRQLHPAPPIDDAPLAGLELRLTGLIDDIAVGHALLIAGAPPLARTVGKVTGIGGSPTLEAGTLVMALAPVPSTDGDWWAVEAPGMGMLSIATDPHGRPPSGLRFLSGNGTTIGDVAASQLALFTRPVQGEAVTVRSVRQDADTNTTRLILDQALRYLYDRTTTTVYGNVVEATQGVTVEEVLGDGDGQKPFLRFMLKQAPLTWLEEADGGIRPQLSVTVNGLAWSGVEALGDCGPDARAYQLTQDAQGRALIQFGDSVHGLRPPTGQANVTATYRVGAGAAGNVAAAALSRPPANIPGIKAVLNPVAAAGGIGAAPRGALRGDIPVGVADLGRIVTQDDMVSFVLNRPEIGAATLSTEIDADTARPVSLVTVAGPGNAVPDSASPAFVSLCAAFAAALASGAALNHRLLAVEPLPFKVKGRFTMAAAADLQQVQGAIAAALRAAYGLGAMGFGQGALARDVAALIRRLVPTVETVEVTRIWAPSEAAFPVAEPSPSAAAPTSRAQPALYPRTARFEPSTGAQILCLSTDADAVTFRNVPSATPSTPADWAETS